MGTAGRTFWSPGRIHAHANRREIDLLVEGYELIDTFGYFPGRGGTGILASVSGFHVVPETVTAHAVRLQGIPEELERFRGPLGSHAAAAAGTRAAVGVESFVGHVFAVLPGFAEASTRLQLAMIAAAAGYARADRAVEDSAR